MGADSTVVPPRHTKQRDSVDFELAKFRDDIEVACLEQGLLAQPSSPATTSRYSRNNLINLLRIFLRYPAPNSLTLRSTSWLDGLRGVAALEVYIFHALSSWIDVIGAYGATKDDTWIFQLPFIRTFFSSGGAAVSIFFGISGYVLTQKSIRSIRDASPSAIYPSVRSSMFRRGFRLFLPPMLVTFTEMVASRFGVVPPLAFDFVPKASAWLQFVDWADQTNKWMNPIHHVLYGQFRHEYDAVIWTIPLEFYGSFVCYFLLLALSKVAHTRTRMSLIALFAIISLFTSYWSIFCFSAGMLLGDFHISQESAPLSPNNKSRPSASLQKYYWALFILAFYVAGMPALFHRNALELPRQGFESLVAITPRVFSFALPGTANRFWWSLSGISMLFCISQLPSLKAIFETDFCQYLGKISFSLYLVHQFSMVLFGMKIKGMLLAAFGINAFMTGSILYWISFVLWAGSFTVLLFAISAQVERFVDAPVVRFSKWLEGKVLRKR